MNRRRIVYPLLVAGLALGVGYLEGRWNADRSDGPRRPLARPARPTPPPTGVEVPMTIGPARPAMPADAPQALPPPPPTSTAPASDTPASGTPTSEAPRSESGPAPAPESPPRGK